MESSVQPVGRPDRQPWQSEGHETCDGRYMTEKQDNASSNC